MVVSLGPRLAAQGPTVQPGATVRIVTETLPDLTGVTVAIGGGPALLRDGTPMQWTGLIQAAASAGGIGVEQEADSSSS